MSAPLQFDVAGVAISAVRVRDTIDTMQQWITEGRRDYIVLTGAHGVVEMQTDAELRAINNAAGLVTPDGMPIVWLGKILGHVHIEKVYAPDIMHAAFAHFGQNGGRHFFYGGKEGVAETLKQRVLAQYPGNQIVGTYCPPFRPLHDEEVAELTQIITDAEPDIVWCGLGCPKQERWMNQFRPLLNAPVLVGVGAGFDFLSGEKPIAPKWVQTSGFEWFYRLLSEPKRLWPRYSRVVPKFLYYVAADALKTRASE